MKLIEGAYNITETYNCFNEKWISDRINEMKSTHSRFQFFRFFASAASHNKNSTNL
jgi:hypothetical protein